LLHVVSVAKGLSRHVLLKGFKSWTLLSCILPPRLVTGYGAVQSQS